MRKSHAIANSSAALARGSALPWLLMLIAIAAGLAAWWWYAPDTMPAPLKTLAPFSPKANPLLYKWKDDKGRLHVTDVPPTDRPYETVRYDPNVNVVPSVVPPGTAAKH